MKRIVTLIFVVFLNPFQGYLCFGQATTFPTGSFIVDMGVTPQTVNNGLRPYGLVYDLVSNYDVPVYWIIKPNKLKDGIDFTHNGNDYKGGPFIIAAENRTPAVNGRIAYWMGTGVVGINTTSVLTAPVAQKITAVPRWTLDLKSGGIAQTYLENAGIPLVYSNWEEPYMLNNCNDIFVLPHADPKWAAHSFLNDWNLANRGSIWVSCHAVSVLENMFNPSNPAQQTNFLALNSGAAGSNSLVDFKSHKDGSLPYNNNGYPADQVMQFMGPIDNATDNGSESIYLPALGGGWRPTTKVTVYDPTQIDMPSKSSGKAALIAYGRGFGNPNRGWVMYEAGHDHTGGGEDGIAAQRAFLNFSYMATMEKSMNISVTGIQSVMISSTAYALSATVTQNIPTGPYVYQWTSSCGGTFSNPAAASTTYTPPLVVNPANCTVTLKVTDGCGRTRFFTQNFLVTSGPRPPVANPDSINISPACGTQNLGIIIDALANDIEPDEQPLTLTSVTGANGTWSINPDQTVKFIPNEGFYGSTTANYTICDNTTPTALCTNTTITVTIGIINQPPLPVNDSYTILEDSIMRFNVLVNDAAGAGGGSLQVAGIAVNPTRGVVSINPDNTISYLPTADNKFVDSFYYRVVNGGGYTATAKVTVNVIADGCGPGYYQTCVPMPNPFSITAVEDTYLNDKNRDDNNTNNYGSDTVLIIDREATDKYRSLIRFNLPNLTCDTSIVPVITGATLKLYKVGGGGGGLPVDIYRANATWNEDQASWNNRLTGTGWTTRGGDFDPTLIATNNIGGVGQYDWTVTSLVSNWYTNPSTYPNQGMLLKTTEGGGNRDPNFVSSESTSGLLKPTLEISFTIPNLCKLIPIRAPMAMPDTVGTNSLTMVNIPVTSNDHFQVAGTKTVSIIPGSVSIGSAVLNGNSINYTPVFNYSGPATFRYRVVNNTTLLADTAVVYIFVAYPAPLAVDDSVTINSGTIGNKDILANDIDLIGAGIVHKIIEAPKYGTCSMSGGNITYTPPVNFYGRDSIKYSIKHAGIAPCNTLIYEDTAYFVIIVNNRPPITVNDTESTNPCQHIVIDVLNNDSDPEKGLLTIANVSAVTPAAAGTAIISGPFILFTPNPAFTGSSASFTYTIIDDAAPPAVSNPATVVINLNSIPNLPPVAADDMANGISNSDIYINVMDNDSDPENDSLSISLGGGLLAPAHGTVSVMPNGLIKYVPVVNFAGSDIFDYRLLDNHLGISGGVCTNTSLTDIGRVFITVTNIFVILHSDFENFTGMVINTKNKLQWTINEIKGEADYHIERSSDNLHFQTIGNVKKQNASNDGKFSYTFFDQTPADGYNFYRIKTVTKFQPFVYSKTLMLKNSRSSSLLKLYPIPFAKKLNMEFELRSNEKVKINMLTADGKLVYEQTFDGVKGHNMIIINNLESYKPGLYYFKVDTNENILVNKAIKLNQ